MSSNFVIHRKFSGEFVYEGSRAKAHRSGELGRYGYKEFDQMSK